jgi:hypothetical protein
LAEEVATTGEILLIKDEFGHDGVNVINPFV